MKQHSNGRSHRWLACWGLALAMGLGAAAQAAPGEREGPPSAGREGGSGGRGGGGREGPQAGGRDAAPGGMREGPPSVSREGLPVQAGPRHGGGGDYRGPSGPSRGGDGRWWDNAYGHSHYYPTPGWAVRSPPVHSRVVFWGGVNYSFYDGVWYSPGSRGYVVVRPPYGIVVADLPAFRTLVTIGGLSYFYANGVYYRERDGGYEVVPTPVDTTATGGPVSDKIFVYPRQGQTAQQQAADEYDCHRWAVSQTGFDPTAAAVGQPSGDLSRRGDYQRARGACLEGRNYTVR